MGFATFPHFPLSGTTLPSLPLLHFTFLGASAVFQITWLSFISISLSFSTLLTFSFLIVGLPHCCPLSPTRPHFLFLQGWATPLSSSQARLGLGHAPFPLQGQVRARPNPLPPHSWTGTGLPYSLWPDGAPLHLPWATDWVHWLDPTHGGTKYCPFGPLNKKVEPRNLAFLHHIDGLW